MSKKNKIKKLYSDVIKSKPAESSPTTPKPEKSKSIQEGLGAFDLKGEWEKLIPGILNAAKGFSDVPILGNLKKAATIMQGSSGTDYWTSEEGQSELLRMIHAESKRPSAAPRQWRRSSLSPLDYTDASNAMMEEGSLSAFGADDEWVEIDLTADSGACDTAILRKTAESIPSLPSLASLRGMENEVASGQSIPNLGKGRCLVWTEWATQVRKIITQVADVHKGLLSLSRCTDLGFEGRFGRAGMCVDLREQQRS